jgi:hypothetical protein
MGSVRSIHDALGQVVELLGEVNDHDLTALVDAEVAEVALLAGRVAKLAEATHVQVAGRLDTSRVWSDDGARSASAWVAWKSGLPSGRAKAVVRCARQLRSMPLSEAAMAAGHLSVDHVRLLARAQCADAEAFAVDEERLVAKAQRLLFSGFEKVIRYWVQVHAPDDAEADAEQLHQQRRVDASRSFEGVVFVDALLDPVTGEIWLRELERLEQEAFEADWAEARARLGDAATASDLARSPKQRRADAMRAMAERSAAKPADAVEPRVLLHVVAGDESVKQMCELSNGAVVTPGQVLPLLRWADVARVIFDGPSRVIDVGVRQRLFTGATRIAVERRDQTCQHPGCDVPAERCQIDHIVPYDEGGPTTQDNGRCYCPFHHRWHHQRQQQQRQPQPAA